MKKILSRMIKTTLLTVAVMAVACTLAYGTLVIAGRFGAWFWVAFGIVFVASAVVVVMYEARGAADDKTQNKGGKDNG
jgi:K+-transporting ATPase A subunit